MVFYHLNSVGLEPGAVIRPGNWGRILQTWGSSHKRWATESILEDVRSREYPALPSRLKCAFFFGELKEAEVYWHRDHQTRSMMLLYEVELTEPGAIIHASDWRNVDPNGFLNFDWARRYWMGAMLPPNEMGNRYEELLAVTGLRIVRQP
jgi:hypothetical protein